MGKHEPEPPTDPLLGLLELAIELVGEPRGEHDLAGREHDLAVILDTCRRLRRRELVTVVVASARVETTSPEGERP